MFPNNFWIRVARPSFTLTDCCFFLVSVPTLLRRLKCGATKERVNIVATMVLCLFLHFLQPCKKGPCPDTGVALPPAGKSPLATFLTTFRSCLKGLSLSSSPIYLFVMSMTWLCAGVKGLRNHLVYWSNHLAVRGGWKVYLLKQFARKLNGSLKVMHKCTCQERKDLLQIINNCAFPSGCQQQHHPFEPGGSDSVPSINLESLRKNIYKILTKYVWKSANSEGFWLSVYYVITSLANYVTTRWWREWARLPWRFIVQRKDLYSSMNACLTLRYFYCFTVFAISGKTYVPK